MMRKNEKDTLNLYVKKDKAKEIISRYHMFGWRLTNKKDNDRYEDIFDLTFTRPHYLVNKDELQLQQVYMEERLNNIAKLERNRHSASTAIGLCLGTLALFIVVVGILLIIEALAIWWGIGTIILGIAVIILEIFIIPRIFKKEKLKFKDNYDRLTKELEDICNHAKVLLGGDYGED